MASLTGHRQRALRRDDARRCPWSVRIFRWSLRCTTLRVSQEFELTLPGTFTLARLHVHTAGLTTMLSCLLLATSSTYMGCTVCRSAIFSPHYLIRGLIILPPGYMARQFLPFLHLGWFLPGTDVPTIHHDGNPGVCCIFRSVRTTAV